MYGHAHLLLEPPCPCGSGKPRTIRSEAQGGALVCARCALQALKAEEAAQ